MSTYRIYLRNTTSQELRARVEELGFTFLDTDYGPNPPIDIFHIERSNSQHVSVTSYPCPEECGQCDHDDIFVGGVKVAVVDLSGSIRFMEAAKT
jgi:hypothetical protein